MEISEAVLTSSRGTQIFYSPGCLVEVAETGIPLPVRLRKRSTSL